MKQFSDHVRENFAPQINDKKREEIAKQVSEEEQKKRKNDQKE